jgi:prevent-host-death family protein
VKKASITEAKNNLSALVARVKAGTAILIVDRGKPVARLEPVRRLDAGSDRLAGLIRQGVVRPARTPTPADVIATTPPRTRDGSSGVSVLLDERRDAR